MWAARRERDSEAVMSVSQRGVLHQRTNVFFKSENMIRIDLSNLAGIR